VATFNYQSIAVYNDSGTAWVQSGEFASFFQLGDGEFGGVEGTTFEAGDILDSPFVVTAWIQDSSATVELKAAISSAMASAGVFHPRVLRGRSFISRATSLR